MGRREKLSRSGTAYEGSLEGGGSAGTRSEQVGCSVGGW